MSLRNLLAGTRMLINVSSRQGIHFSSKRMAAPLKLMDLPRTLVSNLLDPFKSRLQISFSMFLIDHQFRFREFAQGAAQAVVTVSNSISKGDFDSLSNLVNESALHEIKRNYSNLTVEQRQLIAVKREDIQGQVPYLYQKVENDQGSTFVKLGMLYFVVPGFDDTLKKVFSPSQTMSNGSEFTEVSQTFKHNLIVGDYRFVREYKKDFQSNWIISELNHWKVADYKDEFPGQF